MPRLPLFLGFWNHLTQTLALTIFFRPKVKSRESRLRYLQLVVLIMSLRSLRMRHVLLHQMMMHHQRVNMLRSLMRPALELFTCFHMAWCNVYMFPFKLLKCFQFRATSHHHTGKPRIKQWPEPHEAMPETDNHGDGNEPADPGMAVKKGEAMMDEEDPPKALSFSYNSLPSVSICFWVWFACLNMVVLSSSDAGGSYHCRTSAYLSLENTCVVYSV